MKKQITKGWSAMGIALAVLFAASPARGAGQSTNEAGVSDATNAPAASTNSAAAPTNSVATATNSVVTILTNAAPRPGSDNPLAGANTNTNAVAASSTNAAPFIPGNLPGLPLYSSFKVINDRNIFDPNRRPGVSGRIRPATREPAIDTFSLTGILSSEKGTFAFFDGSGFSYKKVVKTNDSIGGYTVKEIDPPDTVKLEAGEKKVELTVGTAMRRRDGGPWEKLDSIPDFTSPGPGSNSDFGFQQRRRDFGRGRDSGFGVMQNSSGSDNPAPAFISRQPAGSESGGGGGDALPETITKTTTGAKQ